MQVNCFMERERERERVRDGEDYTHICGRADRRDTSVPLPLYSNSRGKEKEKKAREKEQVKRKETVTGSVCASLSNETQAVDTIVHVDELTQKLPEIE